ncbi:MAG TPA: DUF167 domain-containing protein [Pontiella sp.]
MNFFEEKDESLILNIRVIPRSSQNQIVGPIEDALKIRIQAPPINGKANAYLIKFLSKRWGLAKSDIEIISGETGRSKRIQIFTPSDELRKELLSYQTR